MNNNRKLKLIMIAVLITVLACAAALTSCNANEVSDILVSSSGNPRLVYVEGQELDLSSGVLTAIVNGEETSIPMSNEEVKVTGYDSNTVGKQTLTVTYKEKTTTIDVTVVARMTAENYETNYFVGDKLDTTKGRLRIARDNATTYTVNLSDPTVTVSFDSSKSGSVNVKVGYKGTAGENYETSFAVNVYDIGKVDFAKPYKNSYSSHDTELDLSGGFFTVKAAGTSNFSKFVTLTQDMVVEGTFNPAAVTIDNRDTPANQKVVFNYAGEAYEFPITIVYSSLSIVLQRIEELSDLDWTKDEVTIDDEHGLAAMDAIKEYFKLTSAEKKTLTEDQINTVVRPATVYINNLYAKELETYSGSFGISSSGQLTLNAESYDKVKADRDRFADPKGNAHIYADLLRDIYAEFEKTVITNKITVGEYVFVFSEEGEDYIIAILDQMMKVYDAFSVIPTGWKVEELSEYADAIKSEVKRITSGEFVGLSYAAIYQLASTWRDDDDLLDIIYSYYLYVDENGETAITETLWNNLPLPRDLQTWFENIYTAVSYQQFTYLYAQSGEAYLTDTTEFMDAYFKTQQLADSIKNGDDQLLIDIYNTLDGDEIFNVYAKKALVGYTEDKKPVYGYGYIYHLGEALGNDGLAEIWKVYLDLYNVYINGFEDSVDYKAEFIAAFDAFAKLSPAEVNAFLSSMHFQYDSSRGDILVLDYSENAKSTFVYLIANYYIECLPDSAEPLFQQLLLAIENCSLRNIKASALDDFKAVMEQLNTSYDELSDEDQAIFDEYAGACYQKYVAIYNAIVAETDIDAPADFEELYNILSAFNAANESFASDGKDGIHALVFALYEKARELYDNIVASGASDSTVLTALYTKEYTFGEASLSLDRAFYNAGSIFAGYMMYSTISSTDEEGEETISMAWEIYESTKLDTFLADAAYLMMIDFDDTYTTDKDTVLALMAAFRALDEEDQKVFYTFDFDVLYYSAIEKFLATVLTEEELALAKAIFEAEAAYVTFSNAIEDTEEAEAFKTEMSEAAELKPATPTDNFNEYLADIYNYYNDKYEALITVE